jgi:hypothetical protein
LTIEVKHSKAFPFQPLEPDFPYLATHKNKGETVLLVMGASEEKPERRVGVVLEDGESSTPLGWGLTYLVPMSKGSAVMLVQK